MKLTLFRPSNCLYAILAVAHDVHDDLEVVAEHDLEVLVAVRVRDLVAAGIVVVVVELVVAAVDLLEPKMKD